jgi:hypothetical protein
LLTRRYPDEPMSGDLVPEAAPEPAAEPASELPAERPTRKALPSFSDVNLSVGSFLAGLEQKILHNRPPAIVVVQEHERGESVIQDGLLINDLPVEPLDRPEPPDTSGARL